MKEIVDEMCQCGHLKSLHGSRFVKGHGKCTVCNCEQFTWISFVYVDKPDKEDKN